MKEIIEQIIRAAQKDFKPSEHSISPDKGAWGAVYSLCEQIQAKASGAMKLAEGDFNKAIEIVNFSAGAK